ncbi:WW domain-containing protein [Caenorhabditis elegans]|uniref:WW domain-containing protein n=2 Tax=Caenorhabditis elegans TaxID=6239 RepID=D7SFQ8_CAEEL|nr:WW domain-containing protein [Caenorhabditis elegans]CBM41206.1 WW domain-containing protein [Caenorhabditis elegans]|eukprot:NP_001256916.1 Uncharacterized protein CELE_F53H2.3 [Caenorhabditis elegans]
MRQNEPPGMPRGTKTLAWFMDRTGIFEKQQQQMMQVRRNSSSDDSKSTTPSAQQQFQQQQQQQQKKQKRYRKTLSQQGTTRKEAFGGSQAMSESSEEGTAIISTALTSSGAPSCATPGISAATTTANGNNNEEYWFYDVATDGYYYEQNGAKGWRRRQPNQAVHKSAGKDSEVAHMNVNGPSKYNQLLAAQAAAAQAAFLQQAFQLQAQQQASQAPQGAHAPPPPQQQQQPTMRYYDANSDGFFYEMASVDGWKRRQPNKPVSASVPAGITRPYSQRPAAQQIPQEVAAPYHPSTAAPTSGASSYGAALARGQFPRNTVKHDEKCAQNAQQQQPRGDSTSSSQCGDTFAELFSSSDPVYIPRPSALNLEQKAVSPSENSTAALFDAVLADFGGFKATSANLNPLLPGISSSQSPMKGESWNSFRSCSLFSPIKPSKRAPLSSNGLQTQASAAAMEDFDDDSTMKMLIQDLDKLWANSPVSGLNQA